LRWIAPPLALRFADARRQFWDHFAFSITGAEVMQRVAVPMIGGMVSSTVLTLLVIPSIYAVVNELGLRAPRLAPAAQREASASPA
jgi:AcrB/AcrD/AcrF family